MSQDNKKNLQKSTAPASGAVAGYVSPSPKPLDFGFYNLDCMEGMAEFPDKYFDLAIVDPPYGIGMDGGNVGYKGFNNFEKKDWDKSIPDEQYFKELFRVSKFQIIWGGNYYNLPPTRSFIIWDKGEGFYNRTYAECEQAWTNFDRNAKIFKHDPLCSGDYKGKIHPCQKPIILYRWILKKYGQAGWKILDTHVGSASSLIACEWEGFDYVGFEIDADYYAAAKKRIENWRKSRTLDLFKSET